MNKRLSFKGNFSWAFFGNAIFSASQWLLLVILAKIGSPNMVGLYTLGLAITSPIIIFSQMQLRQVQVSDAKDEYDLKTYLYTRLLTNLVALLIIFFVTNISGYDSSTVSVIILIGILKTVEGISDIYYGHYQKNERMDIISKSRITKGLLNNFSFIVLLYLSNSLVLSIITMILFNLIVLLVYDRRFVEKVGSSIKSNQYKIIYFKQLIRMSLPLGIVLMMTSLLSNIPRYFIEAFYGLESLGFYASVAYLMVIGTTFITALGQVAAPRLAKYYAQSKLKEFMSLAWKFNFIGLILGILGIIAAIFLGEIILKYAYTEEYMKYNNIFIILMIAATINYAGSIWGYCLTAARRFKIQPILGIIWLATALFSSYLLIPEHGLIGAAYAQVLTSIIQLLSKMIVVLLIINKKGTDSIEKQQKS